MDDQSPDDRTIPRSSMPSAPETSFELVSGNHRHPVRGRVVVGREPSNSDPSVTATFMALDDPTTSLSKSHAAFDISNGQILVVDLGSTNGTSIDGPSGRRSVRTDQWDIVGPGEHVLIDDQRIDVVAATGGSAPIGGAPETTTATPGGTPDAPAPITGAPSAPPPPAGSPASAIAPPTDAPPHVAQCTTCGAALEADDRFCIKCGTPLASAGSEPAGAANGSKTKLLVGIAVVAVLLIVGAVVGLPRLLGSSSSSDALRVPSDPQLAWTERYNSGALVGGTRDAVYVVTSDRGRSDVYRLNGSDGTERWTTTIREATAWNIATTDEIVLVSTYDDGFDESVTAFDVADGNEVWRLDLRSSEYVSIVGDTIVLFDDTSVQTLDPRSGRTSQRVRGTSVNIVDGVVLIQDRFEVAAHSVVTLERIGEPVPIPDGFIRSTYLDGQIIVVIDDEISAYDADGDRTWRARAPQDFITGIWPISGGGLLLSGSEGVDAVQPDGNRLSRLWTDSGTARVYQVGDDTVVAVESDGRVDLLDDRTGTSLGRFGADEFRQPTPGDSALFVVGDDRGDPVVQAIDVRTGDVEWRLEARRGRWLPLDGAIVLIDTNSGRTDLEFYR